jgi:hypothetical protein
VLRITIINALNPDGLVHTNLHFEYNVNVLPRREGMYLRYLALLVPGEDTVRDEPSPGPESYRTSAHGFFAGDSKRNRHEIPFEPDCETCLGLLAGCGRADFPYWLPGRKRGRFESESAGNNNSFSEYRVPAIWQCAGGKQQDPYIHRQQFGS